MSDRGEARATFSSMDHSTMEDWVAIGTHFLGFAQKLPDRVLDHLRLLDGDYGGFAVDRLIGRASAATEAL